MQNLFQHFINGTSLGSIYALIALGYTMVYGILQLINFAHSDVFMVGAFTSYYVARHLNSWLDIPSSGLGFLILLLCSSMIVCSILSLTIERLAYRPLRGAPKINALITAIGVSLFLQYSGQVIFGVDPKTFPTVFEDSVLAKIGDVEIKVLNVVVLTVTFVMMFGLHYLIFKTKLGKAMRATSHSMTMASLMGVNTDRTIAFTFIVGSSLAGVGSVLVGMQYPKIDPLMGMMFGMKAFIAAVLGGIGNIGGAVLGGIIMGLSEEFVSAYISSTYRDAFAFGILILILIFRPAGLLGQSRIEKV